MHDVQKVRVELGAASYDIFLGEGLSPELCAFVKAQGFSRRALILSDENVGKIYGEETADVLRAAGLDPVLYSVPAGEASKSLAMADEVFTCAIEAGLDRRSPVFALGGGVVGDLAGFIAAAYMRGVPFVQLPTSLLAQVDSSVGGKVAVNHRLGKNLIGAFYQPAAVFADFAAFSTLPEREVRTGLGEIVKYGIIFDEAFFAYLEDHAGDALRLSPEAALHMVRRSCEIKAEVVSKDEKEGGLRRILNYGHTIGHAIEKETGYVRYNHGEAVAIGSLGAAYISEAMGMIDAADVLRVHRLTERLGLPLFAEGCMVDGLYAAIFHDKKTIDGRVNWVLMEGIGKVCVRDDVPETVVRAAMERCLKS